MDAWGILGLNGPTSDLKAIKHAYAKKLRVTRPDENPEGFMALRDALEQAQFSAQYVEVEDVDFGGEEPLDIGGAAPNADHEIDRQISQDDILKSSETSEIGKGLRENLAHKLDSEGHNIDEQNSQISSEPEAIDAAPSDSELLIADVQALLADTFGRNETARWQAIFDDPKLDGIDTALDFEDQFRGFILSELGFYCGDKALSNRNRKRPLITTRVGTFIFNQMGWRETNGRPQYIQRQIEWLRIDLDVINQNRPKSQVQADIDYADQYFDEIEERDKVPGWAIGAVLFGLYVLGKFLSNTYG